MKNIFRRSKKNKNKLYTLPELAYPYNALKPFISGKLHKLYHDKHYAVYIKNGANAILEKMYQSNTESDRFLKI